MSSINFCPRAGDQEHWHIQVDGAWTGWRLRVEDGALIDHAGQTIGTGVSKGAAAELVLDAVRSGRVATTARHPDDEAALEERRMEIGYVEPPRELWPLLGPQHGSEPWEALHDWFEDNGVERPMDAVLVFYADRAGGSLSEAYQGTDGWAKRRSAGHFPGGYN